MTYNLTSALFIAVFFAFQRILHGRVVLFSVLLGFAGMLLVYKPATFSLVLSYGRIVILGITSALAYITVNRLAGYCDNRIIACSLLSGPSTGALVVDGGGLCVFHSGR